MYNKLYTWHYYLLQRVHVCKSCKCTLLLWLRSNVKYGIYLERCVPSGDGFSTTHTG